MKILMIILLLLIVGKVLEVEYLAIPPTTIVYLEDGRVYPIRGYHPVAINKDIFIRHSWGEYEIVKGGK